MKIIIYTITMLASFLGLFIGIVLSNIAVEEIYNASKYLKYLNLILVPIIVGIATYNINRIYSIIFSIITLILLVLFRNKYNNAGTYASLGALLYVSTSSNTTLNISILIFLYGISITTINASAHFADEANKQITISENISLIKKIMIKYSYYLLIGMIFYVTFSYIL